MKKEAVLFISANVLLIAIVYIVGVAGGIEYGEMEFVESIPRFIAGFALMIASVILMNVSEHRKKF